MLPEVQNDRLWADVLKIVIFFVDVPNELRIKQFKWKFRHLVGWIHFRHARDALVRVISYSYGVFLNFTDLQRVFARNILDNSVFYLGCHPLLQITKMNAPQADAGIQYELHLGFQPLPEITKVTPVAKDLKSEQSN